MAAPALGASAHGAKGFLAGLGAGLAGAVVLPVAGLVGGLTCAIGGFGLMAFWGFGVLGSGPVFLGGGSDGFVHKHVWSGGVVNTPASVVQMLRGRQWCPLQRKWIRCVCVGALPVPICMYIYDGG